MPYLEYDLYSGKYRKIAVCENMLDDRGAILSPLVVSMYMNRKKDFETIVLR